MFERRSTGSRQLSEIARWPTTTEISPFVESELRLLAEVTQPDREIEMGHSGTNRSALLAIAASTTSTDIILAVELDRVGPRDDAALIAAVSSLASVIDRSGLIDDLLGEARTDPLTGLANRRQLKDFLSHAVGRAARLSEPLAVVMIDLDHFKAFNDSQGHAAGDRVLRGFASQLRVRLRSQDVAARYGGEEFCLLLPATSEAEADLLLDDLRARLGEVEPDHVTFSAGVAQLDPDESGDQLLARADKALYRAKKSGRNRTIVSEPATTEPASVH